MPIDDSDDKVRRNLVVFSALVLASAWLGRPEMWVVTKLIAGDVLPPAWKVTVLALCILIYLAARYWFSQTHVVARREMAEDWEIILSRVRDTLIVKALKNYHRTRKQPAFIDTNLKQYLREDLSSWSESAPTDENLQFLSVHVSSDSLWQGTVTSKRRFSVGSNRVTVTGGNDLSFRFPHSLRAPVSLMAAIRHATFSRTAVEYYVPIALAYSALLVLAYRLSRHVT